MASDTNRKYMPRGRKPLNPYKGEVKVIEEVEKRWILDNENVLPFNMASVLLNAVHQGFTDNMKLFYSTLGEAMVCVESFQKAQ